MGLEFDTLKNNGSSVVYNNTTGFLLPFFDFETFCVALEEMKIQKKDIKKYFHYDEILEHFSENDISFKDSELTQLFEVI